MSWPALSLSLSHVQLAYDFGRLVCALLLSLSLTNNITYAINSEQLSLKLIERLNITLRLESGGLFWQLRILLSDNITR